MEKKVMDDQLDNGTVNQNQTVNRTGHVMYSSDANKSLNDLFDLKRCRNQKPMRQRNFPSNFFDQWSASSSSSHSGDSLNSLCTIINPSNHQCQRERNQKEIESIGINPLATFESRTRSLPCSFSPSKFARDNDAKDRQNNFKLESFANLQQGLVNGVTQQWGEFQTNTVINEHKIEQQQSHYVPSRKEKTLIKLRQLENERVCMRKRQHELMQARLISPIYHAPKEYLNQTTNLISSNTQSCQEGIDSGINMLNYSSSTDSTCRISPEHSTKPLFNENEQLLFGSDQPIPNLYQENLLEELDSMSSISSPNTIEHNVVCMDPITTNIGSQQIESDGDNFLNSFLRNDQESLGVFDFCANFLTNNAHINDCSDFHTSFTYN